MVESFWIMFPGNPVSHQTIPSVVRLTVVHRLRNRILDQGKG